MRKALYFSKPQPLSPKSKTWEEGNTRYQKNKNAVGGKTSVKGVPTTDSIYYLWFEYLKRSEKYKKACANNGKGMTKLYKDFGNIFEYEGVDGFWVWWNERGQYLFGITSKQEIVEFDTADEVVGYEDYKLIAIPKNVTATTIKKRLNKLVDDMKSELKPTAEQTAKYSIAQTKVDVKSLKACLMAYDLKQQGTDILEIGLRVREIKGIKAKRLIEDGRKKGKEIDYKKLLKLGENNIEEYNNILCKAEATVKKRNKDKDIDTIVLDEQISMEMRIYKVDYVRTARKKSIRTNTHKLINKAVANIEAVEEGMFGVGH
jgi:hypothetical protein